MYTRQTYHILGMILSWTTIDFDGMLGLERKRKREREGEGGRRDGESISVCLGMPEEEFEIVLVARAGRTCYVRNFKTPSLSQIIRTLSVRSQYRFY